MDYVCPAAAASVAEPELVWSPDPAGHILLVDDDAGVRAIAGEFLRDAGYSVREAASGEAALALVQAEGHRLDLLVTDMDMPGISGQILAARLRASQPSLKVIVISGRTPEELGDRLPPGARMLEKPFRMRAMLSVVKELLEVKGT